KRPVAGCAGAKSAVFLPYVLHRKRSTASIGFDQAARLVGRPVVGNDELEVECLLGKIAFEHGRQCVGPVVSGQDDANSHILVVSSKRKAVSAGLFALILSAHC